MKFKKEYLILILIIAALLAYLFMRSADRTFYELPPIASLEQNQITKIEKTGVYTYICTPPQ